MEGAAHSHSVHNFKENVVLLDNDCPLRPLPHPPLPTTLHKALCQPTSRVIIYPNLNFIDPNTFSVLQNF